MRTLRFIVNGNTIKPDPNCDFSGLFPGREPHVNAEFEFSKEWQSCIKVVGFWSMLDAEYTPQQLEDGFSCMIPTEALERPAFKMQVFGGRKGINLQTNKIVILQAGGKK